MGMKEIRERYAVPAKRGAVVRYEGVQLHITGSMKGYHRLNIRGWVGKELHIGKGIHPFDLDYLVDGEWVSGETLKQKYDERWRQFNQRLKGTG